MTRREVDDYEEAIDAEQSQVKVIKRKLNFKEDNLDPLVVAEVDQDHFDDAVGEIVLVI